MKTTQWLYFGCHQQPGHYLFYEGMRRCGYSLERLTHFDGKLPPQDSAEPYIATISRLEGWGMTALAFWDYSVDKRGGCNSVVFAPSLDIAPAALLAEAMQRFPQVFERLPRPVQLLSALRDSSKPALSAELSVEYPPNIVDASTVDRAWARFCGAFGDGPDAPYPGMIAAFETHYGQSFRDAAWRTEAACWAAAWHKATEQAAKTKPLPPDE